MYFIPSTNSLLIDYIRQFRCTSTQMDLLFKTCMPNVTELVENSTRIKVLYTVPPSLFLPHMYPHGRKKLKDDLDRRT